MFKMPVGLYEKALPASMCWEERLTAAGQAGYDFVEISIDESNERLARLDWSASERRALRRSIANSGVKIMTMCLSGHRKYPLGSHTPELRQQGRDILRKAIEFAGDVGLRVVQVMAYDVFYETSDNETEANFMEGLERGTRWAGQCGVMLGLENLDTPFVDSIRKALAITHEITHPGCIYIRTLAILPRPGIVLPMNWSWQKDSCWAFMSRTRCRVSSAGCRLAMGSCRFETRFRRWCRPASGVYWELRCGARCMRIRNLWLLSPRPESLSTAW